MTRNIIITGADNGIGLALTKSLLEMGDQVAALDLSLGNLPRSSNLLPFTCDVTDPERVQAVMDEILRQWGGVDILINNVCLALFTCFDEHTQDDIRRGLAKLVGKTRSMLATGILNNLQLWMSYHMRVPMGKLMSMLSDKARQNKQGTAQ